jgi:AbrB family looped-hinge helix DNA binding protein
MQVSIDSAGRIVVPKPLRQMLGLTAGATLEIELVEDHLELSANHEQPTIVDGPNGPVVAKTATSISDGDVRRVLEVVRERG